MGRSAKFAKRPTKKEKSVSKTAKEASKPLPRPIRQPSPEVDSGPKDKVKKRRMMRMKVEKKSKA